MPLHKNFKTLLFVLLNIGWVFLPRSLRHEICLNLLSLRSLEPPKLALGIPAGLDYMLVVPVGEMEKGSFNKKCLKKHFVRSISFPYYLTSRWDQKPITKYLLSRSMITTITKKAFSSNKNTIHICLPDVPVQVEFLGQPVEV